MKVAVVGGGVAGLTAARALSSEGHQVRVLEQAPGPGGRLSTGLVGGVPVEEGAPHFSVRTADFRSWLAPFIDEGVVRPRAGRLHRWVEGRLVPEALSSPTKLWTVPGGMSRLAEAFAEGLPVRHGWPVRGLGLAKGRWLVHGDAGEEEADALVLALPAPDALSLARTAPDAFAPAVVAELERVVFDPSLGVLATYSRHEPGWSLIEFDEGPLRRLVASDHGSSTSLVVLASADLSREAFGEKDDAVVERMLALGALAGGEWVLEPRSARVVRWRAAWPRLLAPARCLVSERAAPAVLCGDWCVGPRLEGAFLSGQTAALRLSLL